MTVQGFAVQPGSIDGAGKWACWNLVDHTGRIVGQTTDPAHIGDLIAGKQMAAILAHSLANVGLLESAHARYQVAEDAFNDPDGITKE